MHRPIEPADPDGDYTVIFVKWFRHRHSGRIIYAPPGRAFPLRVRVKRDPS
jgi:hypothetical protein